VTVADGTFTQAMLKAQTTPPNGNVTYNFLPGGAIYFATSTPAGQPNFAPTGNILNANGRAVTLFVGGATGAINLDGTVTLTADPPPATTLTTAVQGSNLLTPNAGSPASSRMTNSSQSDVVGSSFTTLGASGTSASLSPAWGILNSPGSSLGAVDSGVGAIQSATVTSLTNLVGAASTAAANSLSGLVNAPSSLPATSSGLRALTGSSDKMTQVLYGGVSGHGKKSVVSGGSSLSVKQLESGARLFSADHDTLLETPMGTVFAARGALVLIVSDAGSLSVYNLDDTRHEAVVVMVGKEKITLTPGRHVTITNGSAGEFERVNPIKTLGYRAVSSRRLADGLTVHNSEFSLPSAMATIAPVKMLISSADQNEKKVGAHLLKTAAILQTISASRAPFQLITPPQTTAMR
jgi:hypothetical protein